MLADDGDARANTDDVRPVDVGSVVLIMSEDSVDLVH